MDDDKRSKAIPIPRINNESVRSRNSVDDISKSTFELAKMRHRMDELMTHDQPRRRSRSAPLTLEATGVAKELRNAGECIQTCYEKRAKQPLARRRTVGGGSNHRLSWPAWDNNISEEDEPVFPASSIYPNTGTSV